MYFSVPEGWNIVKTDKLEKAAKILQGTKITCGDYSALLEEPRENVLIYADPPYLVNSKLAKTSQLYKHNFSEQDHVIFAEKIKSCQHKVIISYDDCDFIRDLFGGFNFYTMDWTYCGTSAADGTSKQKRVGKELLITNY
jgi:DNA adenine methylase